MIVPVNDGPAGYPGEPCHLHYLSPVDGCPTCARVASDPGTVDLFTAAELDELRTGTDTEPPWWDWLPRVVPMLSPPVDGCESCAGHEHEPFVSFLAMWTGERHEPWSYHESLDVDALERAMTAARMQAETMRGGLDHSESDDHTVFEHLVDAYERAADILGGKLDELRALDHDGGVR